MYANVMQSVIEQARHIVPVQTYPDAQVKHVNSPARDFWQVAQPVIWLLQVTQTVVPKGSG